MLEQLKEKVLKSNLKLPEMNLVTYTWGNVSGIAREKELVVIKPSGVSYTEMGLEDMVVVNLKGQIVEGNYKPSSDTLTHLELYKAFSSIGGIVHTHSPWATSWAQACREIPAYGTTHADYFCGNIPCTKELSQENIQGEYEKETGSLIVKTFKEKNIDASKVPAVLVANHGPFAWGYDPENAVHNAVVLEEISKTSYRTEFLNNKVTKIKKELLDRHFLRKHGEDAYYGQD